MDDKLISIIVPIYNTEKYLKRCIDSIIKQSYKNLQIILIDDGSTDDSLKICKEYEKNDSRIEVIHTVNKGLSFARNLGIKHSKGDLISFIDSDDWIANNLYKEIIELLKKCDADIIDFKCKLTNKYEMNDFSIKNYNIIKGKDILEEYLKNGITSQNAPFSSCKKIYKKEILKNITFPEGKINEDISTIYKYLLNSKSMIVVNDVGYYYFQNIKSITVGGFKEKDLDLITACQELNDLTKNEKYGKISYYSKVKLARCYFSLLAKIAYYGIEDEKVNKKETVKYLIKNLRNNYWLLIRSPIVLSRKILITMFCINFSLCEKFFKLIKRKGR